MEEKIPKLKKKLVKREIILLYKTHSRPNSFFKKCPWKKTPENQINEFHEKYFSRK